MKTQMLLAVMAGMSTGIGGYESPFGRSHRIGMPKPGAAKAKRKAKIAAKSRRRNRA